jgi:hypothetical protein
MKTATMPASKQNSRLCSDVRRAKEKAAAAPTARPEFSMNPNQSMVETSMFPRSFASCEAISTVQEVKYGIRRLSA